MDRPDPVYPRAGRLEEDLGAATRELTDDDLQDVDEATARIEVQGARYPEQLERLVDEERLAEPVSLADLASVAGLSVSQFSRQFKARTGLTPHRFLLGLRLGLCLGLCVDRACRLLRTDRATIADVAVRCGFSHQEHLTRVVRAQLDTTPGAVRRGS